MARRKSYQRGSVGQQNGFWTVRYYWRDDNGKMVKKREKLEVSPKAKKKEALRAAESVIARVNDHNNNPQKAAALITFRAFTDSRWRAYHRNEGTKDSTMYNYDTILRTHLFPAFGDRVLADIAPAEIGDFFEKLYAGGASRSYASAIYTVLNTVFQLAEDLDVIAKKPVRAKLHRPKPERNEKPILPVSTMRDLIFSLPLEHRMMVFVLAITCVRINECLAFRWLDFDATAGTLAVNHTLWRRMLQPPKSKKKARVFELPPFVVNLLVDHRRRSEFTEPTDYIFSRVDGRPFDDNYLRTCVLYPALKRLGIEKENYQHGFHLFRHIGGSLIYEKTGKMKLAQATLGHSLESTTSQSYVHVRQDSVAEAVSLIAAELVSSHPQFIEEITSGEAPVIN